MEKAFPPPPRRIRRIRGFGPLVFMRLIVAPIMLALIAFCLFAWWVSIFGTRVQGRIIDIYNKEFSNGTEHYFARYTYDADGVTHREEQRAFGNQLFSLKPDAPVPVRTVKILGFRYSTLADGSSGFLAQYQPAIIGLSLAVFIGAGAIGHRGWLVPRRHARLIRDGEVAPAIITGAPLLPGRAVGFRFKLPTGEEVEGVDHFAGPIADPPRLGQSVSVIYDPKDPDRHVVYEWCDFEILPEFGPARS